MPTPSDPTGFDAFFSSISSNPEFQKLPSPASFSELDATLRRLDTDMERAAHALQNMQSHVADVTPPLSEPDKKTGNAKDEKQTPAITVEHFTRKEGKPFGFEAIAGMDDLKNELRSNFIKPLQFQFLVEKLKNETVSPEERTDREKLLLKLAEAYEKFQISIPTGMLFYGPPGTGKTFITKRLAEELGAGFIAKSMGEFGSSYLHQTTKNIKEFFAGAKEASIHEPIILFLDEIDSLVSARTDSVDANKAEEVSQFLQEFNGLSEVKNLIVIAATNRPDHLDPAILRSGRLDKKIYLGPPDAGAREALFRMYIEKAGRPHEILDYARLAQITDSYVSADIEAICDEVARDASRGLLDLVGAAQEGTLEAKHLEGHAITMADLEKTISETPSSLTMVDMTIYTEGLEQIGATK